jgi:hypothetical protein
VAFLDSDDDWFPEKLHKQLQVFEQSHTGLGLVYTGVERVLADGTVVRHIAHRRHDLVSALLRANVIGGTSVGMARREVFDAIGSFDENLPSCHDVDLWLRIAERFEVGVVADVLVKVVQRTDRGRISENPDALTLGRERFCRKYRQKLIDHGALHLYLRESGWVYHRYANNNPLARRCYREAIATRPSALAPYLMLLATYVPMSWLERMARAKRSTSNLVAMAWAGGSGNAAGAASSPAPGDDRSGREASSKA